MRESENYIQVPLIKKSEQELRTELKTLVRVTLAPNFYESYHKGEHITLPKNVRDVDEIPYLQYAFHTLFNFTENYTLDEMSESGITSREELFDTSLYWIAEVWQEEYARTKDIFLNRDTAEIVNNRRVKKLQSQLKIMANHFENPVPHRKAHFHPDGFEK